MDIDVIRLFISDLTAEMEEKDGVFIVKIRIKPKKGMGGVVKDYLRQILITLERIIQ